MASLKDVFRARPAREALIDDACVLVDSEVNDKSGLSGAIIKAAFRLVKGVKPAFIREALDHFLDDFLDALEPVYQDAVYQDGSTKKGSLRDHVVTHSSQVADALLSITDKRAARAPGGAVRKTYEKLRPTAKKHVEAAAPRLGTLLEKHTSSAS